MKAFRFPLQSLRVLREQKEQAAQKHYAEALRAAEEAAARLKAAGDELSASWSTLTRELAAGVTAMELLRTRAWCNALELRLKERTSVLEKARLAVDAVWQEMLNATRDRESLDRYYKKNRRAHDRKVQSASRSRWMNWPCAWPTRRRRLNSPSKPKRGTNEISPILMAGQFDWLRGLSHDHGGGFKLGQV